MAPLQLSKLVLVSLLSTLFVGGLSKPTAPRDSYVDHALRKRAALNVVKTTTTDYHTIDWIPIESQGDIASPPPARAPRLSDPARNASAPASELQAAGVEVGPAGTVPVPRVSTEFLETLSNRIAKKQLPPKSSSVNAKRQYSGNHWYVSSDQGVANLGGSAIFSIYNTFVDTNDFSLLQTAISYSSSQGLQTAEAGWQIYPANVAQPHLFTYFNTNGYSASGNNLGGYNQQVEGWVQVDSTYFPGTAFSPMSTIGGAQYELDIEYYLYEGNWWLYVIDRYIGYYPASLYSASSSGTSLSTGGDTCFFYGEIAQSEDALTTTDMGSGEFASAGWEYAAYIRNMNYIDTNAYLQTYTASFWDSDSARYTNAWFPNSGTNWENYVFLGGPGAGGVIGA